MNTPQMQALSNEELLNSYEDAIAEWTKAVNFNPRREKKCAERAARLRQAVLDRMVMKNE